MSVCLSVHLLTQLYFGPFVRPSAYPCERPGLAAPVLFFLCILARTRVRVCRVMYVCLYVYPSVDLTVPLSVRASVYLSL